MTNKYWMLSLEASQILQNKEKWKNKIDKNNLSILLENFIIFDDSLEKRQIEKIYSDKCRKKMYISSDNNNLYTLALINVKFDKVYFSSKDKKTSNKELRNILYENGFSLFGINYVRYKRSSGSAREGNCLFIDKRLLNEMNKWSNCGLKMNGDLASWESYRALSLSSIKGTIKIPLNGILFIPDAYSEFIDDVISVDQDEEGKLFSKEENTVIENTIWDGESLLDESIFDDYYPTKHMLLLRNKFFKSCAFKTKLQKWFKDNNITCIDQLLNLGFITTAAEISEIKMVTTPCSLKYLKFKNGLNIENIKEWISQVDDSFGVVKYDMRTKYFKGRLVQTSYQFLNTLLLNEQDVNKLLDEEKNYLKLLRSDIDILRYYFKELYCKSKESSPIVSPQDIDYEEEKITRMAELTFKLININDGFAKTSLYKDLRNELTESFKNNMCQGHLLIHGRNATLFGNGPELLLALIGKFNINNKHESSRMKKNEVYCKGFDNHAKLLCARSPHITMGNLYVTRNSLDDPIWKYFDLGENIIGVNAIGENIQQRLNGCDYDSDFMLVTNEDLLINVATKCNSFFKTPVCKIVPKKVTNISLAELDTKSSDNRIGQIINLSQLFNSIIWDKLNSNAPSYLIKHIYSKVCQLAVLSGIEIDKAKRNYNIDSLKVINDIKKSFNKEAFGQDILLYKPLFLDNDYEGLIYFIKNNSPKLLNKPLENNKVESRYDYKTSMNFIFKQSYESYYNKERIKYIDIMDIFLSDNEILSSVKNKRNDYNKKNVIIDLCLKYNTLLNNLYSQLKIKQGSERKDIYNRIAFEKSNLQTKLDKIIDSSELIYLTLKNLCSTKGIGWNIYEPLLNNQYFLKLIKVNKTTIKKVKESIDGEISIFSFNFTKID